MFIGPGTISASVIIGKKHEPLIACAIAIGVIVLCAFVLALLKWLHDIVKPRREEIVQRYIEIAGRVTALVVGTIAIDMIMRGLSAWVSKFSA